MGAETAGGGTPWGAIASGATGVLGLALANTQRKQQMRDNRQLMNLQLGNQMTLNKHQQELAMQMWKDTNYSAQVDQMKQAGLNVGLMYEGGGAGGATTGGAQGGSASMGQAPTDQATKGIGMALQLGQQQAQLDLMRAQTKKLNTESEKIAGVDTEKATQEIANLNSTKLGQDIENALNNENYEAMVEMTNTNLENAKKDGTIKDIQVENLDAEYKANIANKIADSALKKAQESLTNQQEKESVARIQQGWKDLQLKNRGLDIQQQQTNIQAFGQETQRNNPSLMNAAGGVVSRGLKAIYRLFGKDMESSDTKVKKNE